MPSLPRSVSLFLRYPHPLHPYHAAMVADAAYDEAIKTFYPVAGGRWGLTEAERSHPAVKAAYQAKRDADETMARFSQSLRSE